MKKLALAAFGVCCFIAITSCGNTLPDHKKLERNKEVVRQVEAAINAKNLDELKQYYTTDYARHSQASPGFEETDTDGFVTMIDGFLKAFPDARQTTTMLAAEGDYVAFWGFFEGTQNGPMPPFPPTGTYMRSDYAGFHRIKNGKIAETWVTWDNMSMLEQLGLLPKAPPAQSD